MNVKFTARRFRAHPDIKEHALETVKKLRPFLRRHRSCRHHPELRTGHQERQDGGDQSARSRGRSHGQGEIRRLHQVDRCHGGETGDAAREVQDQTAGEGQAKGRAIKVREADKQGATMKIDRARETRKKSITVGFLYEQTHERFKLKQLNGENGFDNQIKDKNLHRPGLALAGYVELFTYDRVQIMGNTEIRYLNSLSRPQRPRRVHLAAGVQDPVHHPDQRQRDRGRTAAGGLREERSRCSGRRSRPRRSPTSWRIFSTTSFRPRSWSMARSSMSTASACLLTGRSGIGKSEIALDLIERGHRLVADDVVMVTRKGEGILMGAGTDLVKHFMEIRGLGLIDVRSMFGIRAIRYQKRVEIVVELEEWKRDQDYTRTGLDDVTMTPAGRRDSAGETPDIPRKECHRHH